jgi:hypothetical protein
MAGTSPAMTMEPAVMRAKHRAGEISWHFFFIIFVDGIFTTLLGWLFTNVFDVTVQTQVIACVYRGCNAD